METKSHQIPLPNPSASVSVLPSHAEKPAGKHETSKPNEKKPTYYTLAVGTTFRTGPLGGVGQFDRQIEQRAIARVIRKEKHEGIISLLVNVESPPELKGQHWVSVRSGGRGFL